MRSTCTVVCVCGGKDSSCPIEQGPVSLIPRLSNHSYGWITSQLLVSLETLLSKSWPAGGPDIGISTLQSNCRHAFMIELMDESYTMNMDVNVLTYSVSIQLLVVESYLYGQDVFDSLPTEMGK